MEPRGAIVADIDLGEGPFRSVAAHLSLGGARRTAQARVLLDAVTGGGKSVVLLGDLNEWRPGGSALGVLETTIGPAAPARIFLARFPLLALDRIMVCFNGIVWDVAAHDTPLARRAADHLPLVACVSLPASGDVPAVVQ